MVDWLTKEEIQAKYKHISKHSLPFECSITKIIPQKGIPFSERWKFLKNLFFITDDNYYFQYSDICHNEIGLNQDGQPYDIFLDGTIRCAYSVAYSSSDSTVISFILKVLSEGKIYASKDKNGKTYFLFVDLCHTYIRKKEEKNDSIIQKEVEVCKEIHIKGKKVQDCYTPSIKHESLFEGPLRIEPYDKLLFYDKIDCSVGLDGRILRYPGKFLQIVAKNNGIYSFLDNKSLMPDNNIVFNDYRFLSNNKNLIWLKINSTWGLYNRSLSVFTIPPVCDDCPSTYFSPDYIIAKIKGKYGVVREDGTIILDFEYDDITSISSTHYKVKQKANEWEVRIK